MPLSDQVQPIIRTQRLELHHLSVDQLVKLYESPHDASIYDNQPFDNPHRVLIDDSGPLKWRVPQVKVDPSLNKWFVRWIVLSRTREIIGSTSFHGPPSTDGVIEIGYGIHPDFQGQGFGPEALVGMWSWAIEDAHVKTLRYTVSQTNTRSLRVIQKFGFTNVGQQIDDVDGPELIFELSSIDFGRLFFIDWRGE